MKRLIVLVIPMMLVIACSSDGDEHRRKAVSDKRPIKAYSAERLSQAFEWPEGKGEPRDIQKDDLACRQAVPEHVGGLQQFLNYAACMNSKGWKVKKPQTAARGTGTPSP